MAKLKKHETLRDSWVWNGDVESFIKQRIRGFSLNVCSGKSPLGNVRVDLDPQDRSIIRADMIDLPFESCQFDTVIQDPPWKIGYYNRFRPFYECVRVCKVGGIIIYNAYWIPTSDAAELKEVYIRQDKPWTNTSIVSIFEKTTDASDGYNDHRTKVERRICDDAKVPSDSELLGW